MPKDATTQRSYTVFLCKPELGAKAWKALVAAHTGMAKRRENLRRYAPQYGGRHSFPTPLKNSDSAAPKPSETHAAC